MKIKNLLVALLAFAAMSACKQAEPVVEPVLEVSATQLNFTAVSDEKVIYVTANNDWSLEADVDWLSFNQESGEASEEKQMVKVYAENNTVEQTRIGKIIVTSGKLTKEVNVTQEAAEPEPGPGPDQPVPTELAVSVTELAAVAEGGELTFTVTSNKAWTVATEAAWVTLAPATGEASDDAVTVKATVAVNETFEQRTAVVTVTAEDVQKTITVTQAAAEQTVETEEIQGKGTETDPYQIRTPEHMLAMRDLAPLNATTWFRLENDIDMAQVDDWIPVNYDNNFERQIHFDGNNKTISNFHYDKSVNGHNYSSIFGVLYGSCRNLKVDNAQIVSSNGCGVIGGYVGTTGKPALLENVTITNSTVTNSGDRAGGICGTAKEATFRNVKFQGTVTSTYTGDAKTSCFAGQAESSVIMENCHASADFASVGQYVGGLIGLINSNATVTMTGCSYTGYIDAQAGYVGGIAGKVAAGLTMKQTYSSGSVKAVGAYVGGLIGASMYDGVTVINCFSTANVNAFGQQAGGLVGTTTNQLTMSCCYASGDVYSATSGAAGLVGRVQKSSTITNCIAWNRNVAASRSANNVYAPGAVLGCAQQAGTYSGCWRRYDMILTDDFMTLSDQEDIVNAMPPAPAYSTETHQQAYHGKAAAPGATLSSLAQSLGWDASIWQFTTDGSSLGFTIKQLGDNKIEF